VQAHLPSNRKEFPTYFIHSVLLSLIDGVHDDFWKFVHDSTACYAFEALPQTTFLSKMTESYPPVTDVPLRALLMLPSTYHCEQGLSAMFCIKTTFCARLCMKSLYSNCSPNRSPGFDQEISTLTWLEMVFRDPTSIRDTVLASIKCATVNSVLHVVSFIILCHNGGVPGPSFQETQGARCGKGWEPLFYSKQWMSI